MEPKLQLASTLSGMGHQRDSGLSHVVARGWQGGLAPLFHFFRPSFFSLCLINS